MHISIMHLEAHSSVRTRGQPWSQELVCLTTAIIRVTTTAIIRATTTTIIRATTTRIDK